MATNDMTSAGQVWPQWIQSATSSSANTTAWTQWNDTGTAASVWTYWASTTNGTTNQPWTQWIQAPQINQYTDTVTVGSLSQRQQTTEEAAAWKRMVEEQERKKQNAQKRALELLQQILTETQLVAFEKDQCIPVDAPSGKKYLIKRGRVGNVFSIKDGKPVERYCIHPSDYEIPDEDCMLAQKLMLENCEEEFLRIANKTRLAA